MNEPDTNPRKFLGPPGVDARAMEPADDVPFLDLDFMNEEDIETDHMPTPRAHRQQAKQAVAMMNKKETLAEVMPRPPEPGTVYHLVSGGKFDYWSWVPVIVGWIGTVDELYLSTWTVSRPNVNELFELFDGKRIRNVTFMSGLYFKRREQAVYALLLEGLEARGQRFRCFENHTKVMLLAGAGRHIVVEGSANLTANPRLEQNIITDDRGVFDFHREWMEGVFNK